MELITQNNLKEKLQLLPKLGYAREEIVILIDNIKDLMQIKDEIKKHDLNLKIGVLVKDQRSIKNAKKADYVVAEAKRAFFENKAVDIILNPEHGRRKDFIHHRNSGLSQVLLNLCKPIKGSKKKNRKNKTILTSFKSLLESKNQQELLGRMKQNAYFAKKYAVTYEVCSFADEVLELRSKKDLEVLQRGLKNKPKRIKVENVI